VGTTHRALELLVGDGGEWHSGDGRLLTLSGRFGLSSPDAQYGKADVGRAVNHRGASAARPHCQGIRRDMRRLLQSAITGQSLPTHKLSVKRLSATAAQGAPLQQGRRCLC